MRFTREDVIALVDNLFAHHGDRPSWESPYPVTLVDIAYTITEYRGCFCSSCPSGEGMVELLGQLVSRKLEELYPGVLLSHEVEVYAPMISMRLFQVCRDNPRARSWSS